VRVLHLVNNLPNGGLERQLALLLQNLPSCWESRVWSMGGGPYESRLRDMGIFVEVCKRRARFDLLPAVRLWQVLQRWRPDVVHAWGWMPALAAAPLCRVLGIPCIDGMIRSGALEPDLTVLKRLGMRMSTLVLANSEAGLRAWGMPAAKGRVIYNGFDWTRVEQTAVAPKAVAGDFTAIMTGRMRPVKDFDTVIEAAAILSQKRSGWRFLLVGDGPDRERLIRRARLETAAGVISFPEPTLEIIDLVRASDVGVLMTNQRYANEGLSNSIMEYMALGLPVVCGDGGGNPELVRDGVTGFIVRPGDARQLADRLSRLRDDPALGAAMGAAGRARIESDFSVDRMLTDMLGIYGEALALAQESRARCPRT
jgi:glycosyltransferase involved in cell wall biosynthesis